MVIHKPLILEVLANQIAQFRDNFKNAVAVKVVVIHMPLILGVFEIPKQKAAVKVVVILKPFSKHITYALKDLEIEFVGDELKFIGVELEFVRVELELIEDELNKIHRR